MAKRDITHHKAAEWLVDYVAGGLDEASEDLLSEHLNGCRECREWLETYRLLSLIEPNGHAVHPESGILARYIVDPAGLDELESAELERHLESCAICRADFELVRASLGAAREADFTSPKVVQRPQQRWRLALAAGLFVAVVGTAIFGTAIFQRSTLDSGVEVSGQELQGERLIVGQESVTASETNIANGADVTMRADVVVALGNGFSVEQNAGLRIELTKKPIRQ